MQLDLQEIYPLFEAIQRMKVFADQKTMADAIPLFPPSEIELRYEAEKNSPDFNLKTFVLEYFLIDDQPVSHSSYSDTKFPIDQHIENVWDVLTKSSPKNRGTLLKLPKSYIVPGGRFTEFFYWDSYFIMLGLQVSGRYEMMNNIVENCVYLISKFGFVPNANRTYFLSRSQPPYFSLMLDLLYETHQDEEIYAEYAEILEREYHFWMKGAETLKNGESCLHVVKTQNGDVLNRYFDGQNYPRPESYMMDSEDFKKSENSEFYRNIRAACESGWDFSGRWFADGENIETVNTLEIATVDLNCLLWHLERTIAKSSKISGLPDKESEFEEKAKIREKNIHQYFWDEDSGCFKDFNFKENQRSSSEHIATLYPLYLKLATQSQATAVEKNISGKFLKNGGLVTTLSKTGQQWDFPNAWAPYQWMGWVAMKNYSFHQTAKKIKENWCKNVERVYKNTGKLMEKYDAENIENPAGGGEYPNQDGFGWTNGVYLKLKKWNKQLKL